MFKMYLNVQNLTMFNIKSFFVLIILLSLATNLFHIPKFLKPMNLIIEVFNHHPTSDVHNNTPRLFIRINMVKW